MLSIDPSTGLILLYGLYPLFSIKSVIFCLISGIVGGIMVFFDKNCKSRIRGFLMRFLIASLLGFIFFGWIQDNFNLEAKEYIAGVIGFFSYPIFNWLFENVDDIVKGVMNKGLSKLGISIQNKKED